MSEQDAVLVGPEVEKVGDRARQLDQHKGNLCDVEGKEFRTEGGRVVRPMNEEELLFTVLRVRGARGLYHLREENGLNVFFLLNT